MLETTLVALQDVTLDKIFDDSGRKALFAEFAKIMQQVIKINNVKKKKRKIMLMGFSSSSSSSCVKLYFCDVLGICIFAGWDLHVNHGSPCFI